MKARRESQSSSGFSDFRSDLARLWTSRRDSILHGTPREINAPLRKQQEDKKRREKQGRRRESLAAQRDAGTGCSEDGPSVTSVGEDVAPPAAGGRRGSAASTGSKHRRGSGDYSRRDSTASPKTKG